MNFKDRMKASRIEVAIEEAEVKKLEAESREAFMKRESTRMLPYHSFLFSQLLMIKKYWWGVQFLILCAAWYIMATEDAASVIRREVGVLSILFVVSIIPELWRNLTDKCIEIEMASYFSLKNIYAARLLIFGIVDSVVISIFACSAYLMLDITVTDIIFQFLIPMTVTAGICFLVLCGKRRGMGGSVGICLVMCIFWYKICGSDAVYRTIAPVVLIGIFAVSCIFLTYTGVRLLKNCNYYYSYGG